MNCWRYVNTKDNPADLISRGVKPSDLVNNQLWLHGPAWLLLPESRWPAERFPKTLPDESDLELKVHSVLECSEPLSISSSTESEERLERIPLLEYTDCLEKALRITAFVIRFAKAVKSGYKPPRIGTRSKQLIVHPPTMQEKALAMECFIRRAQLECFSKEKAALEKKENVPDKSKLIALRPLLDKNGIMRVGGRLSKATVNYEMKHPAIIPKGSRLAWLLMDIAHRRNHHGGIQLMTQHIRRDYWIPQLRDELKKFTRKCLECVREKALPEDQLMGDLPADRVNPGRAFEAVGVDFAGPFAVKYVDKDSNVIMQVKAWVAVFVCMKTRAVHLDMVNDLMSSTFVACYERFVARRGHCYKIYSDNGTSFIGAEREIAKAYKTWTNDGTLDSIANKGAQWKFMTPAAPHQGGIYEAAVKSMKYHLKRIAGARVMEYVQFGTPLCGIEAVLNSRPLTPLTDDPEDMQALTPGHFLIGEPFVLPPVFQHVNESDVEGKRAWNARKIMMDHFWQKWQNEYLTTLQERKKWRKEKEGVKVGQLVLIRDETLAPAHWKMGRIAELLPGADKLVRNVLVRTAKGAFKRPVQKLCILPVESQG